MTIKELTEEQVRETISEGEFAEEVRGVDKRVAVVMTQHWCPQWKAMNEWLGELEGESELTVFTLIYDNRPYGEDFMNFKEKGFKNEFIPYIRYYREKELVAESNYVSKKSFLANFK